MEPEFFSSKSTLKLLSKVYNNISWHMKKVVWISTENFKTNLETPSSNYQSISTDYTTSSIPAQNQTDKHSNSV